jgi:hypothetical protein
MLVSYTDEAGHFDNPSSFYVAMAGFIAPEEMWQGVAEAWELLIQNYFHLQHPFHMKDFAHRKGEFVGWTEVKRQALLSRLIKIITITELVPVAAVVSIEGYKSLNIQQQTLLKSPWHVAFQICTRTTAIFAGPDSAEKARMVYSRNLEYGANRYDPDTPPRQRGNAAQLWDAIKVRTMFGRWMHSCSFEAPEEVVQLQVADLFAYEICKEFENQQKRPNALMRWPLRQILALMPQSLGLIRLFDRKELIRLLIEGGFERNDEALGEVGDLDTQMLRAQFERSEWIRKRIEKFDATNHPPAKDPLS